MKTLIAVLIVIALLPSCAYYSLKKTDGELTVKAITWRDTEAPFIHYEREQDQKIRFRFSADSIDNPGFDDLGEAASTVLNVIAYCKAYPAMCTQ